MPTISKSALKMLKTLGEEQKIVLPEIIPGLNGDDAEVFKNWLTTTRINFKGWLSQKMAETTSQKCKLVFVCWVFDSYFKERISFSDLKYRHARKSIENNFSEFIKYLSPSLVEHFWNNIAKALDIPFCESIISNAGGVSKLIFRLNSHNAETIYKLFCIISDWPEDKDLPDIFDPKDSSGNLKICEYEGDDLFLKIAKKTNNSFDKRTLCNHIAYLYIIDRFWLNETDLTWIKDELKSNNFNNLLKDNLFFHCGKNQVSLLKGYIDSNIETDVLSFFQVYNKQVKRLIFSKAVVKQYSYEKKKIVLDLNLLSLLPPMNDVKKQQHWIKILSEPKYKFSHQKIDDYQMILKYLVALGPKSSQLENYPIGLFKNFEQEVSFICSMFNVDFIVIKDTEKMLENLITGRIELRQFNIDKFIEQFRNKCNSVQKIHDWLSYFVVNKDAVQFTQKISSIHNTSIGGGLKIFVPFNNNQLVKTGSALSICVGNGGYLEKIINNRSYIMFIINEETGHEVYCVELSTDLRIIQAKGFRNNAMNREAYARMNYVLDRDLKKEPTFWNILHLLFILHGNKVIFSLPFVILAFIYLVYYK